MRSPILDKVEARPYLELPVQPGSRHAPLHPVWVFDDHLIARGTVTIDDLEPVPARRHAWRELQAVPALVEAKDRFQSHAIQPRRRAGVPRPPAPAGVRRL